MSRWRLILALIGFVLWAHPSLVGLPCAALLLAAPDRAGGNRSLPLGALIGTMSIGLLLLGGSGSRLDAVTSAYIVLVTGAFLAWVLLAPAPVFKQALRAIATAGIATALLIALFWGRDGWNVLAWEATREAGLTMRLILARAPNAFPLYEPVVRFSSITWPGMLALQTFAGLALAWQLHQRVTSSAVGMPLARFVDFRIGDGWVWGIVACLGVLILPVLRGVGGGVLQIAGANFGLVAGTLYVLRGAAIVAAFAEAFGISTAALLIAGGAAAAFALPLVFILPGLCTLGITDTWYQYRRRLAMRPPRSTAA